MYLPLNISTTPNLTLYKPQHCTVLDPITGNFKASYFCRILDECTRRAMLIRIHQRLDKWSCTLFEDKMLRRKFVSKRKEVRGILKTLRNAKRCGVCCPPHINGLIQLRRMR